MEKNFNVISPMATGNGAHVVHKLLERRIPGYHVISYNPYRTLFPPSLFPIGRSHADNIIHTAPDYAWFFSRKNIPLIITFHNYVLDRFMAGFSNLAQTIHYRTDLKLFTRLSIREARMITAVSRFTADLVKKDINLSKEIRVIYNGVDQNLFIPQNCASPENKKNIIVLFSGNLTRRKGAQWLIPIAERLKKNITIMYTSGLQPKGLWPKHHRLQCLGSVPYPKMPEIYQQSDILLFPTVREGFGLAATEAMACGLPVVATDCSSLPELIDNGKGGFLCPIGDVAAFAEKINFLAENPKLRREMGGYNRAKVEKMFTLDRMVGEYQQLFEEVLSKRP